MSSAAPTSVWRRRMKWAGAVLAVLIVILISVGYYIGFLGDNFRVVSPGKCYRSAQLSPCELDEYIRKYGIKSVVSVRGKSDRKPWSRDEADICKKNGCEFYGYPLQSGRMTSPKPLLELIERLETGPYPMLIHCRQGADRTGLASVFYRTLVEKQTVDSALPEQLTWRYAHINWGNAACIDEFFELYRTTNQGRDLKTWLRESYPQLYLQRNPTRAKDLDPESNGADALAPD